MVPTDCKIQLPHIEHLSLESVCMRAGYSTKVNTYNLYQVSAGYFAGNPSATHQLPEGGGGRGAGRGSCAPSAPW